MKICYRSLVRLVVGFLDIEHISRRVFPWSSKLTSNVDICVNCSQKQR
jgi:hypothetical protein